MKCPTCRNHTMQIAHPSAYRYALSDLSNVILHGVTIETCPGCGEETLSIPRMAELHRTIALAIANQPARLSGAEIRFLRKHLGWSGVDFAHALVVTPETVSRWENEKDPMGPTAERLLRLLAVRERPIEDYPTARLADVARDDGERWERIDLRMGQRGWQVEMKGHDS